MNEILPVVLIALESAALLLLLFLLGRRRGPNLAPLEHGLQSLGQAQERSERSLRDEVSKNREEASTSAREAREELARQISGLTGTNEKKLEGMRETVEKRLGDLIESNEKKLEAVRMVVETRLTLIQENNTKQLDLMRSTVDEKLQGTLEKRLGESFKLVSDRLELVHKGLGEMQTLASGVGDLKRVLTNVKTRGGWGEVQLEALLAETLSPDQYDRNVRTREQGGEMVEFAIKLPGRGDDDGQPVWLPIDAKFPVEDYQRLVEAQEKADVEGAELAGKMLETRIKGCARDICDKYLSPPRTTDFGIMFLPTEGLYAEVIRRVALVEVIQRDCRVIVAGPTTLWALLNSLQMGFRTLAIQKRSSEVWNLLGAVKSEFGKFGDILDGVRKKLEEASNKMDDAARRSRAIERRLKTVEELPAADAGALLLGSGDGDIEEALQN